MVQKPAVMAAEARLRRDIGLVGSAAIVFNGVVGAGIFGLPDGLATQFGGFSPWLFPVFGVLILFVAAPFASLAARFEGTGGPIAYVEEGFGRTAAFQVGWLYYLARVTAFAANASLLVEYGGGAVGFFASPVGATAGVLVVCFALTAVNVVGVRRAIGVLTTMSVLKLAPILAFALAGVILFADHIPAPGPMPSLSSVEAAALAVLYAFIGFEGASVTAGETKDPKRAIGRSYLITLAGTAVVYVLVQLAYMAVVGPGERDAPLIAMGEAIAGPVGGVALLLAAIFSLTGNLTASMLSAPRLPFAIAERGAFPGFFKHVSARFGTPSHAIIFTGILAGALAVTGGFVFLAVMSTLARLLVYFASIASLPVIMTKRGEARGGGFAREILFAVLGAGVSLYIVAQAKPDAWVRLAILIGIGFALFLGQSAWRRMRRGEA